jgi:hypothetical protein
VGPRTGLDDVERRKIFPTPGLELQVLGPPARSQLLYRLRYPGSLIVWCLIKHWQNFTFYILPARPSGLFRSGFPTKIMHVFLVSRMM